MQLLTGAEVAASVRERVKKEAGMFIASTGIVPCLAVVLVGDDGASRSYVASKKAACEEMGFKHIDFHLEADCDRAKLFDLIRLLNQDESVHGILVQFPLPSHFEEYAVMEAIDPAKDVDGLNPKNLGKLLLGQTSLAPCTPSGILQMCDYYHIKTSGRHAVVIGRSAIVGKPIASMLMQKDRNATVTICHSKTEHLEEITRQADILVVAMGKAEAVCASMVKPGAVVIDVGINRIPDASKKRGYRIVGDVDFDSVSPICSAITPVPKGVGPMTIAMLMSNTLSACTMQHGVMQ